MNVVEKNKLKVILVITSILTLVFIVIVGIEYLDEKRRDRALKYYNEISTTVILADTPSDTYIVYGEKYMWGKLEVLRNKPMDKLKEAVNNFKM